MYFVSSRRGGLEPRYGNLAVLNLLRCLALIAISYSHCNLAIVVFGPHLHIAALPYRLGNEPSPSKHDFSGRLLLLRLHFVNSGVVVVDHELFVLIIIERVK